MKLAAFLLLAIVLAGCTSAPPASNTNATGQGGNAFGNDTSMGMGTTPPGSPPPASPPPSGTGTGSGTLAYTNPANPVLVMTTSMGTMKIQLFMDKTPITAGNFLNLTKQGYFDGQRFHRVIKDFMNQAGDPLSKDTAQKSRWGTGGPGYTIVDEFPCKDGTMSNSVPAQCSGTKGGLFFTHEGAGILSMANTGQAKTGGSQFFLTAVPTAWLDGKHAIFGKVVEGLDVALAINKVPTAAGDKPVTDVLINTVKVEGI